MEDWRLHGQQAYLTGVTLVRQKYRRYRNNPQWDHDHCEFCGAKFMVEDAAGAVHEGFSTEDDYRWVCTGCFDDFKTLFEWTVREPGGS